MSTYRLIAAMAAVLLSAAASAQVTERVVVEADRLPNIDGDAPFTVEVIGKEELLSAPQLRLDDILRNEVPGFSLFRRNGSRVANPTTQGVTLRNFGPSGAGRTLVLLDGIPVNDPFAGYVIWNQLPPSSLGNVLVSPGGGAGLFGNAALAGTIFLISDRPQNNAFAGQLSVGNEDTFGVSALSSLVHAPISVVVFGDHFYSSGYPVIRSDQRGRVDNNASADSETVRLDSEIQLSSNSSFRVTGDHFHEDRGNGTLYTENATTGVDVSTVLTTRIPGVDGELRLGGYYQHRKFRSTFSSVNLTRDVEVPALDQFNVPADAAGGSAVWSMAPGAQHHITLGCDVRWVEGETNENFRFIAGEFTRLREAGGRQLFGGAFAEDAWTPMPAVTLVASVRFDHWQLFDGFRNESDLASGVPTLTSRLADRDGNTINGRLGARVRLTSDLSVRAAGYSGFRVPTLNELYRPFRVGNDVTEANANLKPERLLGGEAGLEWRPTSAWTLSGTGFVNRLEDAVGNVTIGFGPGTFDPGGFIPAGGVLRQRRNIDLITAPGVELSAEWRPTTSLRLKGSYTFTKPTIERASDPVLVGNLLAQTPQNVFVLLAEWKPSAKWLISLQGRYTDRQFEDDQNSRVLAPFTTVDAAIFYEVSRYLSAGAKVENLWNTEIETGKSATGLTSIGAPRLATLQLRLQL